MEVENMSQKELLAELREAKVDTSKFFEKSDLVTAVLMLRRGELKGEETVPPAQNPTPQRSAGNGGSEKRQATGGSVEIRQEIRRILNTKCYYEILKVERTATDNEISRSYKKMALKLHPDKCREERGEEAFKIVTRAYDTLSKKRDQYDAVGGDADRMNGGGGMPADFNPEDIFRELFGMGGMGGMGGMPGNFRFTTFGPGGSPFHANFNTHRPRRRAAAPPQHQPISINPSLILLGIPLFIVFLPLISSLLPYLFILMLLWGRR